MVYKLSKDYIEIKQFAEIAGVSVQSIYKRLKKQNRLNKNKHNNLKKNKLRYQKHKEKKQNLNKTKKRNQLKKKKKNKMNQLWFLIISLYKTKRIKFYQVF